jgi:hypothetical protein
MRSVFVISLLLSVILTSSFNHTSITVYLTGRLKRYYPEDTLMSIKHLPVFVTERGKVLDKDVSNEKGVFHLSWNDKNQKPYKPYLFYVIIKRDTFLLATVKTFESDTPDLTLTLPTSLAVSLQGKLE